MSLTYDGAIERDVHAVANCACLTLETPRREKAMDAIVDLEPRSPSPELCYSQNASRCFFVSYYINQVLYDNTCIEITPGLYHLAFSLYLGHEMGAEDLGLYPWVSTSNTA